jgi:hypothetical protein
MNLTWFFTEVFSYRYFFMALQNFLFCLVSERQQADLHLPQRALRREACRWALCQLRAGHTGKITIYAPSVVEPEPREP